MKRNKSLPTLGGERNYENCSSSSDSIYNPQRPEDRKMPVTLVGEGPSREQRRSMLDELSRSGTRKEKLDSGGNAAKTRADSLMAREVERLQRLKLELMRINDERRKSYAGFEYNERRSQRRLSVTLGEHYPIGRVDSEMKTSGETEEPKKRGISITLPIDNRTQQLPRIQPLNFKTEQSRRVKQTKDDRGDERADRTDSEKIRDKREQLSIRYGSPLPCQLNDPLGQGEKARKPSKGPQITVSGFDDLNLKVKDFVQKSQPGPSETSLRVARKTKKLPSIDSEIKQNRNTKLSEDAKHLVVNTETCPQVSFYEDRSWYYQDKRGKCRYLRIPDSPVPPISSVFEKD